MSRRVDQNETTGTRGAGVGGAGIAVGVGVAAGAGAAEAGASNDAMSPMAVLDCSDGAAGGFMTPDPTTATTTRPAAAVPSKPRVRRRGFALSRNFMRLRV
jgi:hypothetical protein